MDTTATSTAKQDPDIKGNPYAASFLRPHGERDEYLVLSASGPDIYVTSIHRDDPELDRCSCPATKPCWHIDAARLRQQIARAEASALDLYRDWALPRLAVEDARLRVLLAEADSWLVRAQLGVVEAVIGERLGGEMAEAG